eukprot:1195204-Prorocentrum_minimum.AAC.2
MWLVPTALGLPEQLQLAAHVGNGRLHLLQPALEADPGGRRCRVLALHQLHHPRAVQGPHVGAVAPVPDSSPAQQPSTSTAS